MNRDPLLALLAGSLTAAACAGEPGPPAADPESLRRPPAGDVVVVPGALCPQLASPMGGDTTVRAGTPLGSEDCLTLDVWAPRTTPDAVPAHGAGSDVAAGG